MMKYLQELDRLRVFLETSAAECGKTKTYCEYDDSSL